MRHSDPNLTANVYTDPKRLDVSGALDTLPSLQLDREPGAESERARATGTETYDAGAVALSGDKPGEMEVNPDKTKLEPPNHIGPAPLFANGLFDREKSRLSSSVVALRPVEDRGLEPLTSCMPCKRVRLS
jgi:hypothetical protein